MTKVHYLSFIMWNSSFLIFTIVLCQYSLGVGSSLPTTPERIKYTYSIVNYKSYYISFNLPSSNSNRLLIKSARRWLCVTTISIVCSCCCSSSSNRPIRSALVRSRLPVGSSARSRVGRLISARAIATLCRWPPESSAGRCSSRSVNPTRSTSDRARSIASAGRLAIGDRRHQHVLQHRTLRQQVMILKHKPDALVAKLGQ